MESFQRHHNKKCVPLTLLAMEDNTPAGMVSLREHDGIKPELFPWFGSLYVETQYRGKGIGEKLIFEIKKHALSLGHRELYLLTYEVSLPKWYSSPGWREIGKDTLFNNPVTVMKTTLISQALPRFGVCLP